jgi:uroporphyrinogen decarboxylase
VKSPCSLRRYPLDAAILFSDILTVPDAMGLGLYFEHGEGPRFERPITSMADVQALPIPDPEDELGYVMNAVRTIRRELKGDVPLIGFSGSPGPWPPTWWRGQLKAFTKIKQMMYARAADPAPAARQAGGQRDCYLNAQIKAGAQAVMVFDTWGGVLTRAITATSLQYMHKIVDGLIREHDGRRVPVTLFTKNGGQWLEQIAATGCDAWVWTGPPTSPTPSAGSATRWRCRATWTPPCSTPARPASAKRSPPSWPASVTATAMSSTWVTASIRM